VPEPVRPACTALDLAEAEAAAEELEGELDGLAERGLCQDDYEWYAQRLGELRAHVAWLRWRLADLGA